MTIQGTFNTVYQIQSSQHFLAENLKLICSYSRDIMLAKSQQEIEMRMTLANAEKRTQQYAVLLKKADDIVEKNDKLLYHSLPPEVGDKLKRGGSYMDACGVFESVTMLYAGKGAFK